MNIDEEMVTLIEDVLQQAAGILEKDQNMKTSYPFFYTAITEAIRIMSFRGEKRVWN